MYEVEICQLHVTKAKDKQCRVYSFFLDERMSTNLKTIKSCS